MPGPCLQAMTVTSGVFGALAKCVKNLDLGEDAVLVMNVMDQLKKVDCEYAT